MQVRSVIRFGTEENITTHRFYTVTGLKTPMPELTRLERSLGCLFGGAMGDAFGYPVELMPLERIRSNFGPEGLTEPLLFDGRYCISDDTQMTLLTADGFLTGYTRACTRGIAAPPVIYIYEKYRTWAKGMGYGLKGDTSTLGSWLMDDPAMTARRAPGRTCIENLTEYDRPGRPEEPRNDSKGCGGLMRVAPLGLAAHLFSDPVGKALEWGETAAASTHGHPLGWMAAAFLSSLIYHICEGTGLAASVDKAKGDCIARYQDDSYLIQMTGLLDRAVDLAGSDHPDGECMEALGEGWVAEETLAMAVFSCLRHAGDFKGCLRCAVNVTGDSDSIGSVAGNILGAYLGIGAVEKAFDISRLECGDKIRGISEDIISGCPSHEFGPADGIWDAKYIEGRDPYRSVLRCR